MKLPILFVILCASLFTLSNAEINKSHNECYNDDPDDYDLGIGRRGQWDGRSGKKIHCAVSRVDEDGKSRRRWVKNAPGRTAESSRWLACCYAMQACQ